MGVALLALKILCPDMNVQKYTRKREANSERVLYSTPSLCKVHLLKV